MTVFTDEHERKLERHDGDLYRVDLQNPGITIRMAAIEERQKRILDALHWMTVTFIGAIITGIADIAVHLFAK